MNDGTISTRRLWTIGHSDQDVDAFMALLTLHGIKIVADVRSSPYSKHAPQFNSPQLERALKASEFQYVFLGSELGGQPRESCFYDQDGHVDYARLAQSPRFHDGLRRLMTGLNKGLSIAIMCGEENPTHCHRRLLIGRVLAERGIKVLHIRRDGSTVSQQELAERDGPMMAHLSLLDDQRTNPWRSTRSVLPKSPPGSSSKPSKGMG